MLSSFLIVVMSTPLSGDVLSAIAHLTLAINLILLHTFIVALITL